MLFFSDNSKNKDMFESLQITPTHSIYTGSVMYDRSEEMHRYLQQLNLNLTHLQQIKNKKRRAEWMFIREVMSKNMPKGEDIIYDEHRKPFFKNSTHYLSISHSNEKIAISVNEKHETGVDLQYITDKIIRIKSKFLNEFELERVSDDPLQLTCHWCIKEALFKIYGKKDAFLKENFEVKDFTFEDNFGTATGITKVGNYFTEQKMELRKLDNYMMAYSVNY